MNTVISQKNPFLSIVLPTYNVEKYIDRCLKSCVSQSFPDIEIIVIDDCGSDDSIAKAANWAEKDKRIKIVSNRKNLGTYHARRVGTEHAKGKYILYVDPDDELDIETAETIARIANNESVDIIFFGVQQIPEKGNPFRKERLPNNNQKSKRIEKAILQTAEVSFGTAGKAYQTKIAQNAYKYLAIDEGIRLIYAEDALFFFAAIIHSNTFFSAQKKLYKYYRDDGFISKTMSKEAIDFKCDQIDIVIDTIRRCTVNSKTIKNENTLRFAANKVSRKLLSRKHLNKRHSTSASGSKLYLQNVIKSFYYRKSIEDLAGIIAYVVSFGKLRL